MKTTVEITRSPTGFTEVTLPATLLTGSQFTAGTPYRIHMEETALILEVAHQQIEGEFDDWVTPQGTLYLAEAWLTTGALAGSDHVNVTVEDNQIMLLPATA